MPDDQTSNELELTSNPFNQEINVDDDKSEEDSSDEEIKLKDTIRGQSVFQKSMQMFSSKNNFMKRLEEKMKMSYKFKLSRLFEEKVTELKKLDRLIRNELKHNPCDPIQVLEMQYKVESIDGKLNTFSWGNTLFVIVTSFEKITAKDQSWRGAAIFEIFKQSEEGKFESVFFRKMNETDGLLSFEYNSNPFVIFQNYVNAIVIKNDLEKKSITHTLISFDLNSLEETETPLNNENMTIENDLPYVCVYGQLSGIDENFTGGSSITDFIENTYVKQYYQTITSDSNPFQSKIVFKKLNSMQSTIITEQQEDIKKIAFSQKPSEIIWLKDNCLYKNEKLKFQINDSKAGIQLKEIEIEIETLSSYKKVFEEFSETQIKVYEIQEQGIKYEQNSFEDKKSLRKLLQHIIKKNNSKLETNAITNVLYQGQIRRMTAFLFKDNKLSIVNYQNFKTIEVNPKSIVVQRNLTSISQEGGLVIEVENMQEGIAFVRVMRQSNLKEILLREPIFMMNTSLVQQQLNVSLCFTSKIIKSGALKDIKTQTFQVLVTNSTKKICNIMTYKVQWDDMKISFGWYDLDKAISLSIIGQNLVVVRDQLSLENAFLSQVMDDKENIIATKLNFQNGSDSYSIDFYFDIVYNMELTSDLTKSKYQRYIIKGNSKTDILVTQTEFQKMIYDQEKSKWESKKQFKDDGIIENKEGMSFCSKMQQRLKTYIKNLTEIVLAGLIGIDGFMGVLVTFNIFNKYSEGLLFEDIVAIPERGKGFLGYDLYVDKKGLTWNEANKIAIEKKGRLPTLQEIRFFMKKKEIDYFHSDSTNYSDFQEYIFGNKKHFDEGTKSNLINNNQWAAIQTPIPQCDEGFKCTKLSSGNIYAEFPRVGINEPQSKIKDVMATDEKSCLEICDETKDCQMVEQQEEQVGWKYQIKCVLFEDKQRKLPALRPSLISNKIESWVTQKLKDQYGANIQNFAGQMFIVVPGYTMEGNLTEESLDITFDQCVARCKSQSRCKSFGYYERSSLQCSISYEDYSDVEKNNFNKQGGSYYQIVRKNDNSQAKSFWNIPKDWDKNTGKYVEDFVQLGPYSSSGNIQLYPGLSHYESIQPLFGDKGKGFFDPNESSQLPQNFQQYNTVVIINAQLGGDQTFNRNIAIQISLILFLLISTLVLLFVRWFFITRILNSNKTTNISHVDRKMILFGKTQVILNMIPVQFVDKIEVQEQMDFFAPRENLGTLCLSDSYLNNPQQLESFLNDDETIPETSLVRELFEGGETQKALENYGLLRQENEIWDDSYHESPLSKCFTPLVAGFSTAQLIMDKILSKKLTMKSREIIMRVFLKIISLDAENFPFKNFETIFHVFDEEGEQKYPDRLGFFVPIESRNLQKYSVSEQYLHQIDVYNTSFFGHDFYKLKLSLEKIYQRSVVDDSLIVRVEHCFVDLQTLYLQKKIDGLRGGIKIENIELESMADIMKMTNDVFKSNIEDHIGIQKIINAQFETTRILYICMSIFWALGFCTPFIIQIMLDLQEEGEWLGDNKTQTTLVCNMLCTWTVIIFSLQEFNQFTKQGFWKYIKLQKNILETTLYVGYFPYGVIRMLQPSQKIIPKQIHVEDTQDYFILTQTQITIISCGILALSLIKAMLFFRFSKGFAQMVRISGKVLIDAAPFTGYFIFWIALFGLFYMILGNTVGEDGDHPNGNDYASLPWSAGMMLYSYRTSIGDLAAPDGAIWENEKELLEDDKFNKTQVAEFNINDKFDGVLRQPGRMNWKVTNHWAADQNQRLATKDEVREMIAQKAGLSSYDETLFQTRQYNHQGALVEPLSRNQTYWVAVGPDLEEWVCISYRPEEQYNFQNNLNGENFNPNHKNEYPGLSSKHKNIRLQDSTIQENFPGKINVVSLQFAEDPEQNYHWKYAITKRIQRKYYISKENMTWQEAYDWAVKIDQKSYGLMSIQTIRKMIAQQSGSNIYNELAFNSQQRNSKGGILKGNVWVHCGNKDDQDMVYIGDETNDEGFYPGMSYKSMILKNPTDEPPIGLAFIKALNCPKELKHCQLGADGWPYVFNKKEKVIYSKTEKLAFAHAGSKEICRDFCQLRQDCNSANYRTISKVCQLFTTQWSDQFKTLQTSSIEDIAIWKVPKDEIQEFDKDDPNQRVLNSPFMVKLIWAVWIIEQFFMLIILLNFLIAIISETYSEDLEMESQNMFAQRAEMNLEIDSFLKLISLSQPQDLYILSANFESENSGGGEQLQEFFQKSKDFQQQETQKINLKIKNENQILQENILRETKIEIKKQITELKHEFKKDNDEIKALLMQLIKKQK